MLVSMAIPGRMASVYDESCGRSRCKGYHLNLTIYPERSLASSCAHELAVNLEDLHEHLKDNMREAQLQYQGPADAVRTAPPNWDLRDRVFVKAKYFSSTRPSKKLTKKYFGPFEIIERIGSQSFTLRLLDVMQAVHPVYHVPMLKPYTPSEIPNRIPSPPPPIEIDSQIEYKVAEVLDSKLDH